jgi:hypothetical protein
MKLPPMRGRTMKAKATAILLMAISTCATAAESLSQADAKFVAEYDRLSQAIDNLCAIWERDLHKPERAYRAGAQGADRASEKARQ